MADKQKREMSAKFESIKKKQKIQRQDLLTLGLIDDDKQAFADIFGSPSSHSRGANGKIQIFDENFEESRRKSMATVIDNGQ